MRHVLERCAPLTGVVSVACTFVGTIAVLNMPQAKDSDAAIRSYFASHSHRLHGTLAFFALLGGIALLLVFLTTLRDRLQAAEGRSGPLSTLVYGAGVAAAVLFVVSALLANATTFAASEGSFQVDPNTFRLLADTAYFAWVAALLVGALVVWATSALVLRTHALPRWYAWLGVVGGASQLFAYFVFPFLAWWIWIVLTSIMLVRPRHPRTSAVAQPAL